MTSSDASKDLVVLVADLNMEAAITNLLPRHQAFGIRKISFNVRRHDQRDPGVLTGAHAVLRSERDEYKYALAVCDRHGCGREHLTREHLEQAIEANLATHWPDRSAAIVIDPELEAWVWTESPLLAKAIGWKSDLASLRTWLQQAAFEFQGPVKLKDPKDALEKVLRHTQKKRSSAFYGELSSTMSFASCTDPAFAKLRETLLRWFSAET